MKKLSDETLEMVKREARTDKFSNYSNKFVALICSDLLETRQQLVLVTGELSLLQRKNDELTEQLKQANEDAEWLYRRRICQRLAPQLNEAK